MSSKSTKALPIDVLLIEDNPGDARLIQEILSESAQVEHQLQCADLLSTGLERLDKAGIDVVLLDLGLPDSQGLDTLSKVCAQAPEVPIVILTGLDDEIIALQAVRQGAQDYLAKGDADSKMLWRVMRYAIERKKAEDELKKAHEELKLTYEQLRESQAQLVQSEKVSALGILVAGVSHELDNPLMGILNFNDYCLKHTTEDDWRYQFLQDIQHETERCIDIVSNLLTFSHMEKVGEEAYQDESLAKIIDRVVNLLSYRIQKEKVSLTQHISENTPAIRLRVNAVQQVLLNLIDNALDALVGSQKKEIRIEVHPDGDFVSLTVADSGSGIAPKMLDKVYDPFFTTKPAGKGTGLGLSISRSLIESHGGDITCESKPGLGTTFEVLLPIERRKEDNK